MVNLVKRGISDARSAEHIYLNRLIVFVEGPSDVAIFTRLFPNREDEILFRTPSDQTSGLEGSGGGGCSAVINRVAQERLDYSNPHRCIGIVDRDVYFSRKEWDILFETDDDRYRTKCTLEEGIKPLIYWEIENYLLDPEVISTVLSDLNKDVDHIESTIRTAIERLIRINAANCVIHEHDMGSIPYGLLLNRCNDEDFASLIEQQIGNRLDENKMNKIEDFVRKHEDFNKEYPPEQYLERSMRIIPGKELISFIQQRYETNIRGGIALLLARQVRSINKIPDHLIKDIEENLASKSSDGPAAYPPDR